MSYELPCDLCRTSTRVEFLSRAENFPLGRVCEPCGAELLADDADPSTADEEPEQFTDRYRKHGFFVVVRLSQIERGWFRAEALTLDGSDAYHVAVDKSAGCALLRLEAQLGVLWPADEFTRAALSELHPREALYR